MIADVLPMTALSKYAVKIDHVAIAVRELDSSIEFYQRILGFQVVERRRTTGRTTEMVSAVLRAGGITVVLVQGTSPQSQVSRYIERYGPGVQHIAIEVRNLADLAKEMSGAGIEFNTTIIDGEGIRQLFTARDAGSGMMYEFIERMSNDGDFTDQSVQQLFDQLEAKGAF